MVMKEEMCDKYMILGNQQEGFRLVYMFEDNDLNEVNTFLNYLLEVNCTLDALYWVSRFDRNEIEVEEPKIIDAYRCVIILQGDVDHILYGLTNYHKRLEKVDFLEKCLGNEKTRKLFKIENSLKEEEIKELASLVFSAVVNLKRD